MLALKKQAQQARAEAPIETGMTLEQIRFRYAISGDSQVAFGQRRGLLV